MIQEKIIQIFFVRHAHVDYKKFDYKGKDISLSPDGWEKTIELTDNWNISNIDYIYTSPLNRCVETIFPLSRKFNQQYIVKKGLQELDYRGDAQIFHKKTLNNINFSYDNGETLQEANRRFESELVDILDTTSGKKIIISTHGTVLSQFMINNFNFNEDYFFKLTYPDIHEVKYDLELKKFTYIKKHNTIKYDRDYRLK